jgi:hypothetical protein
LYAVLHVAAKELGMSKLVTEIWSDGVSIFDECVSVDESGKMFTVYFVRSHLLEDERWQCPTLLVETFKMNLKPGLLKIAAEVAQRLHLSPKVIVDEDKRLIKERSPEEHVHFI